MRVPGARRSDSYEDDDLAEKEPQPTGARKRLGLTLRITKIVLIVVVVLLAAIGLLFVLTPSAGQATALAQAEAREHHIAYPGPPVPAYFAQALVATEDHRFYSDPGLDPLALARVLGARIRGHQDQGGSTIDQQLAKNLYTQGRGGFFVELEQVAVAIKLNMTYSRAEILRLYAEVAYFGHGYYGLTAASCGYLGRPPAEMIEIVGDR